MSQQPIRRAPHHLHRCAPTHWSAEFEPAATLGLKDAEALAVQNRAHQQAQEAVMAQRFGAWLDAELARVGAAIPPAHAELTPDNSRPHRPGLPMPTDFDEAEASSGDRLLQRAAAVAMGVSAAAMVMLCIGLAPAVVRWFGGVL